jgi:dienelactone hydrolase
MRALHLLQGAPHVRDGQLAVAGASMGGEAALLIGATFPLVGAVISIVGSGLITQGISQDVRTGSFLKKDSYTCTSTVPTAPPRTGVLINLTSP